MVSKRKRGPKPQSFDPKSVYNRKRQKYYQDLIKGVISEKEYNHLMDLNLQEFKSSQNNKSLEDFKDES